MHKSQLTTSIEELQVALLAAQSDADHVETQIAYKDAEIDDLKSYRMSTTGTTVKYDAAIRSALEEKQKLCDSFVEKSDKVAILSNKLDKKQARLSSIAPVESTSAPDPRDNEEAAALLEVTATPWKDVFVTSSDGTIFIRPTMLQGVPTAPITEDGPYWESSWLKFGDAINEVELQHQHNQDMEEKRQKSMHGPLSPAELAEFNRRDQRYQRSMNIARVARKWFCPGRTLHPNQMLAKRYLPDVGFCQPYNIYQICNILSRLNVLYERGELAMQPIYFLLWRMSVVLEREPQTGIKSFTRAIVEQDHASLDPILRQAAIRAAQHTNDYNCYGRRPGGFSSSRDDPLPQPTTTSGQASIRRPSNPATPVPGWNASRMTTGPATTPNTESDEALSPTKRPNPATLPGRKRERSSKPSGHQASAQELGDLSYMVSPSAKIRRLQFEIPLKSVSLKQLAQADATGFQPVKANNDGDLTAAHLAGREGRGGSTQNGATQVGSMDKPKNSKHSEFNAHKVPERAPAQSLQHSPDITASAARQTGTHEENEGLRLGTKGDGSHAPQQESPDVEITGMRTVQRSPFPRTGRRVAHGFIFPWLPCTEQEAMESWY